MTNKLLNFARKNKEIFWDTRDFDTLSEEKILERILNFGSLAAVRILMELMGKKRATSIFLAQTSKRRNNYKPEIKNLFTIILSKYA